ncbi:MAG: hypothetical protein V3V62_07850, partial [bacterium]
AGWSAGRFKGSGAPRAEGREKRLARIVLAGAVLLALFSVPNMRCIRIDPKRTIGYPARAVALLRESGGGGNLVVHFDWGEYVIWHLAPRFRVSMDGRRETVYSPEVYREFLDFLFGRGRWDAHLERKRADFVLVPKKHPVFNLMKLKPGWRLIYEDPLGGLFAPEGAEGISRLLAARPPKIPHDGAGMCFP